MIKFLISQQWPIKVKTLTGDRFNNYYIIIVIICYSILIISFIGETFNNIII